MNYSKKTQAIIALCITSLGYTFLSVAVRFLNGGFTPFTQVYLRIGLGFVLSLLIFSKSLNYQRMLKISMRDWTLLILMGTFGYGLAVGFVTLGVLHTKLLNVAVITATIPFFTFLYSFVFLRKHVNKMLFLFMLLSSYGVMIISTKSFIPSISQFNIGDFYVLLFAAGTGCYPVCRRFVSKSINNREMTIIVMFIAFITSLIMAFIMREKLSLDGFTHPIVLLGLGIGLFFNFLNTQLENFAFQYIKPVIGVQLLLLENIFAPILGFALFQEHIIPIEIFGALVVISSVIIANRFSEND